MGRRRFSGGRFDHESPDDDTSVDLAAVRRDDALIDAISGDGPVETETDEEYELATLLADWRAEILAEPMPVGPDLDEVVAAVNREIGARETFAGASAVGTGRTRSKGQLRLIRPLAGAAALVAVALGGATAISYGAEPGDPLWGVKQVVFSEQAQSTEARIETASTLERAEQLIAEGNPEEARALLSTAESRSSEVRNPQERSVLDDWMQRLTAEIEKLTPQPQVPPPPVTPEATLPEESGVVVQPPVTSGASEVPQSVTQSPSPADTQTGTSSPPKTTVDPTVLLVPPTPADTTTPSETTAPPTSDSQSSSVPQSPSSSPQTPISDTLPRTQQNGGTDVGSSAVDTPTVE
ncbi:anti-sigma-D factor RsdA [Rhodococcus sp. Z13]|uniref:Anti-sigma-D factor RsdA n=1 Tax=Rhodococcus sacchari TaxID=2962047 RepID=A0ACD4DDA0_9NOCA|nr:anti-sigma-D factor RsdA [Rhodococcus sp. Z13]UYP17958.1 anti-sigma-D factor RsdA [Rhodococcus sp. Z13]